MQVIFLIKNAAQIIELLPAVLFCSSNIGARLGYNNLFVDCNILFIL